MPLADEGRAEMEEWAVETYRRARSTGEPIRPQDITGLRNIQAAADLYDWHLATLCGSILSAFKPRLIHGGAR